MKKYIGLLALICACVLGIGAAEAGKFPTMTLPENWNADPEALADRFVALFEEPHRLFMRELAEDLLSREGGQGEVLLRWMALVEVAAAKPDARLFFLVESLPDVLAIEPPYRGGEWNAFLGEADFRARVLLAGPEEDWHFTRGRGESTFWIDLSPDPVYSVWTVACTARALPNGETLGVAVYRGSDRYGEYPKVTLMRVRRGKIIFTDPAPMFQDFFVDPADAPEVEQNGLRTFYPAVSIPEEEQDADMPLMHADVRVLFEELTSDDSHIGASLFQTNRDGHDLADQFDAPCRLIYEWDGERYRMTEKICKKDDEWGSWPYGAEDAPPR